MLKGYMVRERLGIPELGHLTASIHQKICQRLTVRPILLPINLFVHSLNKLLFTYDGASILNWYY